MKAASYRTLRNFEIDLTVLSDELRANQENCAIHGLLRITLEVALLKAIADSVGQFPLLNARVAGDEYCEDVWIFEHVDLWIYETPPTPPVLHRLIRAADAMDIQQFARVHMLAVFNSREIRSDTRTDAVEHPFSVALSTDSQSDHRIAVADPVDAAALTVHRRWTNYDAGPTLFDLYYDRRLVTAAVVDAFVETLDARLQSAVPNHPEQTEVSTFHGPRPRS